MRRNPNQEVTVRQVKIHQDPSDPTYQTRNGERSGSFELSNYQTKQSDNE